MSALNWTRVKEQDNLIKHRGPSAPGFEDSQWSLSDTKDIHRRSELERAARRETFTQLQAYRMAVQDGLRKRLTTSQRLELLNGLQRSLEHCSQWGTRLSSQETNDVERARALLRIQRASGSTGMREIGGLRATSSPPDRSATNDRSHRALVAP